MFKNEPQLTKLHLDLARLAGKSITPDLLAGAREAVPRLWHELTRYQDLRDAERALSASNEWFRYQLACLETGEGVVRYVDPDPGPWGQPVNIGDYLRRLGYEQAPDALVWTQNASKPVEETQPDARRTDSSHRTGTKRRSTRKRASTGRSSD